MREHATFDAGADTDCEGRVGMLQGEAFLGQSCRGRWNSSLLSASRGIEARGSNAKGNRLALHFFLLFSALALVISQLVLVATWRTRMREVESKYLTKIVIAKKINFPKNDVTLQLVKALKMNCFYHQITAHQIFVRINSKKV
jgi:hypothetical protein